jgi:hypothetical protein
MRLELKKQISKIAVVVFMASSLYVGSFNLALALGETVTDGIYDGCSTTSVWNCAEIQPGGTPQQKNCPNINSGLYIEAKIKEPVDCIREGNCINWGKKCAVSCSDPTVCGSCECRCSSIGDLKCEDKWLESGIAKAASCTIPTGLIVNNLPSNGKNVKCVPTVSIITPTNNATFLAGVAVAFNGSAKDPIGETITAYSWHIRTIANNNAGIFTQDIIRNTEDFSISTIPADSYYAFFSAKNANGIWSDWVRIRFTINPSTLVNGACSAVHFNCTAGSLGTTTEYADSYQWWCNGLNGGSNILCTEFKPTLTFSANPTSLPSEGGNSTLTWTTTNALSCRSSANWSDGAIARDPNDTQTSFYLATTTLDLTCWNGINFTGTSVTKSVTIEVADSPEVCVRGCLEGTTTECLNPCGDENHTCTMQYENCDQVANFPLSCGLPACPVTPAEPHWREVSPN